MRYRLDWITLRAVFTGCLHRNHVGHFLLICVASQKLQDTPRSKHRRIRHRNDGIEQQKRIRKVTSI